MIGSLVKFFISNGVENFHQSRNGIVRQMGIGSVSLYPVNLEKS